MTGISYLDTEQMEYDTETNKEPDVEKIIKKSTKNYKTINYDEEFETI